MFTHRNRAQRSIMPSGKAMTPAVKSHLIFAATALPEGLSFLALLTRWRTFTAGLLTTCADSRVVYGLFETDFRPFE